MVEVGHSSSSCKKINRRSYDDLFNYIQQFEKLVNASRAKKLDKSHDPLVLVAHTGSSSRTTSPYYVTHPFSIVDYDDDYQGDALQTNSEDPLTSAMILLARAITQRFSNPTNNRLCTSSNTRNQAIVQADKVNIQSKNSGNDGRNTRRLYVQEEIIEGNNVHNDAGNIQRTLQTTSSGTAANMLLAKQDKAGVTLTNEQNDFLVADATRMEEIEELSANICLMARIQPANIDSDAGPSYDYAFLSEVQTPSTSYVNLLFAKDNKEQKYLKQPKIINNTNGDDQIDSNIIFDESNVDVNSRSVKHDNNVQASYALEQLALYAYKEVEKQQINANKANSRKKSMFVYIVIMKVKQYVQDEIEKIQRDSIEIQEGMQKQINILENDMSKMEKLENENVSLEFKVQSLIKERENVKLEYQKLFDSIKKTRTQTQREINELIEHVNQKTYANAEVRTQNQDLLITISELQAKLKNVVKGLKAASSVRGPSNRDSSFKNSVLANTKKSSEKVEVSDMTNQKPDVVSKNVVLNEKIVTNFDVKNALKAKDLLCVSCAKNVLIPCHDKCLANYKLNVHSKVRRSVFTTPRTVKSKFEDTTPVVSNTRFSVKTT
ncbi:hypothetical protein Tco_0669934 [Tanacetum coccineum]